MTKDKVDIRSLITSTVRATEPTAEIILFGSRARGDFGPSSDWDVLVLVDGDKVTDAQFDALNYELWNKGLDLGEEINVVIRTKSDWARRTPSLFHYNVTHEGIKL
ncbi:MAG: nucleotidyltransferase domain-containing protein [Bacteroidales bacterium]|nr:nucleotidyltransferase domain-containing protein [Bacteroidales bacterium]